MSASLTLDFSPFNDSGYILESDRTTPEGRQVRRYMLIDSRSDDGIERACESILSFIQRNDPTISPVFQEHPRAEFRETVRHCPYLTINRDIICLSPRPREPESTDVRHRDLFFPKLV